MSPFKDKYILPLLAILVVADGLIWGSVSGVSVGKENTELYFLNIGQGDSQLIIMPGNVKLLIDGGPPGALTGNLAEVLPATDRYIDLVLMTHPQLDHFGGFMEMLKSYEVGAFISSGRSAGISAYGELRRLLEQKDVPYISVRAGDELRYQDVNISVISPTETDAQSDELNDTSVVIKLVSPDISAIYTGDIGARTEEALAKRENLTADVLKVAHHGSRFSSGNSFVRAVNPSVAVIGVGKNSYGHPTKQAMDTLSAVAQQVLRTDQQGIIKIVRGENGALVISNHK